MEEMDAFFTLVALACGWAPASLAYLPARVRENAFKERRSHDAAADGIADAAADGITAAGSAASLSEPAAETNPFAAAAAAGRPGSPRVPLATLPPTRRPGSTSRAWPAGGKCSVRAQHLSAAARAAVQAMVVDEEVHSPTPVAPLA